LRAVRDVAERRSGCGDGIAHDGPVARTQVEASVVKPGIQNYKCDVRLPGLDLFMNPSPFHGTARIHT